MWKKSVIDNLLQQKKVLSIKDLLEYPNLSAW